MKHIYVLNSTSRGSIYGIGTYIEQLVYAIKDSGVKITVVKYLDEGRCMKLEMEQGIRYITMPSFINNSNISVDNSISRYCKSLVIALIPFVNQQEDNIFHLNHSNDVTLSECLKKYFSATIIKTVHFTEWSFQLLGDKRRIKALLKQEITDMDPVYRNLIGSFNKERETLNNNCDKIIAISQHSYNDLVDLYKVNPQKITLIHNSLKDIYKPLSEAKKLRIKHMFNISSDMINIVFAGRIEEIKGVYILIKAFELVLAKYKNIRLYMAGDGHWPPVMNAACSSCSNISYTGFLTKKELYGLYSVVDIGIVPSIHEEFGYVAIEMMMHNLPIIVSNSTGLAEIVEHEKTGLITNIKNGKRHFNSSARNLAENIIRLIEDPDLRQILAVKGRQKFKSHYDIKLFTQEVMKIYNLNIPGIN